MAQGADGGWGQDEVAAVAAAPLQSCGSDAGVFALLVVGCEHVGVGVGEGAAQCVDLLEPLFGVFLLCALCGFECAGGCGDFVVEFAVVGPVVLGIEPLGVAAFQ